jgi:circadian clock protein KaiC
MAYAIAAAGRGERSAFFAFDEGLPTMMSRSKSLGMPLDKAMADGLITLQQIDPAELSPGEFTAAIRRSVEERGVKLVIIDSLNGYMNSMPDERFLVLQMHELLAYLAQLGVMTILVLSQHGFVVGSMETPVDLSYLSDTVISLRYFESAGRVRRAIAVAKKRTGNHEHTIREYRLGKRGLTVGSPLTEFSGILTGTPVHTGDTLPELSE